VGGNKTIEVDVRLVAATHRDLEAMVKQGKFREDLFFRIRVVQIVLPPLRDRPEDIPILAEHFRQEYVRENGKGDLRLSGSAMEALRSCRWPGNVRELRTAIEHGVVLARGKEIELKDLPSSVREGGRGQELPGPTPRSLQIADLEEQAIQQALRKTNQNITEAAKLLGISRRTLHRKIAARQISSPKP
jgi:DNA-binding NtrC family response regulator